MTRKNLAHSTMSLQAGGASLDIDLTHGARIASLRVAGCELLGRSGPSAIEWGAFPMSPFAGRLDRGRLRFGGEEWQLPVNLPPHAIHGTVLDRRWTRLDDQTVTTPLGDDWPFAGRVTQRFELTPDHLRLELRIESDGEPFPASAGWHPWFRRRLGNGEPVRIVNPARAMLARGADGLPDGTCTPPGPGPWDDCFTDLAAPIELVWPGVLRLEFESDCDYWVIFDGRDDCVCVEPQTAPPNRLDALVEPGRPLTAHTTWTWTLLDHG